MAEQYDFTVTLHDLDFILKQIKISEAATNAEGFIDGDKLRAAVGDPLLPYGLRTVDGSWNNLLPGQELYGAADQTMPRLVPLDLKALADDPELAKYLNASGPDSMVTDTDPRMISNIISDQTKNNPAAVGAYDELINAPGGGTSANGSLSIPNLSPDVGLSPAFNGWMTFFGQFFDHGLDLIPKEGNGIVFIPLVPGDPLYVEGSPTNFMLLTRAKVDATHNTVNTTTPWIDQNQTYTSHPSHQIFLREYAFIDGKPEPTGHLLNGEHGIANWGEVKAHALKFLGIQLTDADIFNVPLLATDRYGNLILSPSGKVQIVTAHGLVEANGGLLPKDTVRTNHAFLDDIAHTAVPKFITVDGVKVLAPDSDNGTVETGTYDNELLDRHFITGDGRGNENIGLTAVHSVFHEEHNRLVEQYKTTLLASNDVKVINQWLMPDHQIDTIPADTSTLVWNGEYLFQAGRFTTEMEYQHLVFEEFARTVQPAVDPFVFSNTADINPAIFAEFAHVVYRFGHSMLTETVARTDSEMLSDDLGLIQAFLNPLAFDNDGDMSTDQAIGAIVRGMTRQVGNEIDEFLTGALRNNLVGLPLDLGALNIARGRDTLMPTLNQAREQFYELTGNSDLKPYTSWADFAAYLKNTASIINFMAAYGQHPSIIAAQNIVEKRAAVDFLLFGKKDEAAAKEAMDFFNSTGAWANKETGLNMVDFWIGGLAERKMEFGGMLGSTFNFVFETQMEMLQDGDRFYYLSRTQGLNMINQLEANSFAALVMRNSDLGAEGSSHVHAKLFMTPDFTLEVNQKVQVGADPIWGDQLKDLLTPLVVRKAAGEDGNGAYLKYSGDGHVVLGGSAGNDTLIGGKGIDSLWGDAGNDRLDGGDEADTVHGGDGDDIITDTGTPIGGADFLHGDAGNDVIFTGNGNDLSFGGSGTDFIVVGEDAQEVFGGLDTDFILGGSGGDMLMGNEGDDWLEGGDGFDTLAGENSELFFNSTIIGHDVLNGQGNDTDYDGEAGDDIMVQGAGIQRNNGMAGFDWAIHKGDTVAANSDLGIPIFVNQQEFILRDRFDLVEGLSGWQFNDVLTGTDQPLGTSPAQGPVLSNNLTLEGVARINGLDKVVGSNLIQNAVNGVVLNPDNGADIILGGGGSDRIMGKAGNDIIDGDAWLNVRIEVRDANNEVVIKSVDSMNELKAEMLNGTLNPSQLHIVREILYDGNKGENDVALYRDVNANYGFTRNADGSLTVNHATVSATLPFGDGTDRLLNIEELEFSDGVKLKVASEKATGNLTVTNATNNLALSSSPSVGDLLRVNVANLKDANGIAVDTQMTYTWEYQVGGQWRPMATGLECLVPTNVDGSVIRVVASFTDRMGDAETLVSAVTSPVLPRDQATQGLPVINDLTPTRSTTLAAVVSGITDGDGLTNGNNFRYQWQMSTTNGFTNIAGATAATYTPTQAMVEHTLRVLVTVTDNEGNPSVVLTSAPTQAVGDSITGNNGNNSINGTIGCDLLDGGAGNDNLFGLAGDDVLIGGTGDDALDGGTGADQMTGGAGNDTYYVDNSADIVTEAANGGTDNVRVSTASYVMSDNVENLVYIGSGNFTGTGNALANTMTGGTGNDTLFGMDGDDTLFGLAGNDTLNGGDGNDGIDGGLGADAMTGGNGNDTYYVDNVGDRITEVANGGTDTVRVTIGTYTMDAFVDVLEFTGNGGFIGTGNAQNNTMRGGNGIDQLNGSGGNDTLTGGGGNDIFIFGANFGMDVVTDYDTNPAGGQDLINLVGRGITAANFNSNITMTTSGTSTVLTFTNGDCITLMNTALNTIQLNDFQLG